MNIHPNPYTILSKGGNMHACAEETMTSILQQQSSRACGWTDSCVFIVFSTCFTDGPCILIVVYLKYYILLWQEGVNIDETIYTCSYCFTAMETEWEERDA